MAEWWEQGACRGMDRELFFPGPGREPSEALAVCRRCPVTEACLLDAMSAGRPYEVHGVWGGTTQKDRMGLKLDSDGRVIASAARICTRCGGTIAATAPRAQRACDTCRGPRSCAECGRQFQPNNPEQAACSRRCAGKRIHKKAQERRRGGGLPPIKHGTPAGYQQHRYRGEDACTGCREAVNRQARERLARRRAERSLADLASELATPAERSA